MDEKSHHLLSKEIVWKDHLFGQIETVFLTHDLELPPTQHASHHQDYYNPENQQWHWKIPMFNSKTSSFMVDFPASHVNFQGGKPVFATSIQTMMGFLLTKKKSGPARAQRLPQASLCRHPHPSTPGCLTHRCAFVCPGDTRKTLVVKTHSQTRYEHSWFRV